ncbi:MAG: S8 family serine peptidase [Thermodesulfobacteriota bacterium]|jgi:bacillopeptidase F|nr:S8 family serine peptidase [Thermodesulfobacteriota bacterium]
MAMGAKIISAILWCVVFLVSALPVAAKAAEVAPQLRAVLARSVPDDKIAVIATLSRSEDLVVQARSFGKKHRDSLVRELKERSRRGRADLEGFLRDHGIEDATELWLINGIALEADSEALAALSEHPAVDTLYFDETRQLSPEPRLSFPDHGWNIPQVGAYELWTMGHSGAGAVVAVLDSGVDLAHPDLSPSWRGNYDGPGGVSWFDPYQISDFPTDLISLADPDDPDSKLGHGTAVTGIISAGDEFGLPLGMAPESRWIAARIFGPDNVSSSSRIIEALGWTLDPNGDGSTADAADIVNNSWGLSEQNTCIDTYQTAIRTLRGAGVAVVAAAGNDGPSSFTSESPGNYPEVLAVGATDDANRVTEFSARGPSACDGGIYPQLVAPGTMITTTNATAASDAFDYVTVAGTSFSAAHLSGALALLRGAFPEVDMAVIENALLVSAVDLGVPGPDNSYGQGLIDVPAAYDHLLTPVLAAPTDGALVDGLEVMLSWGQLHDSLGYPRDARIRIATDADFSNQTTVTASAASSTSLLWAGAVGMFLFSPMSRRWRRTGRVVRILLITAVLGFGMLACGGGGGGDGDVIEGQMPSQFVTRSVTLGELEPGITYYWKVEVERPDGRVIESAVRSFTVRP